MSGALSVISPGLATTVQDHGRFGAQHLGVPTAGALDTVSLRLANWLVGNPDTTAGLEIVYRGPTLRVEADNLRVALVGEGSGMEVISVDDARPRRIAPLRSVLLRRGEALRIGALSGSPLAYLAVEGGFELPSVLGSLSTYVSAGIGGLAGRALRAGDRLPLKFGSVEERADVALPAIDLAPPQRFRVVLGPQADYFSERGIATFLGSQYSMTPSSDRMGMRLDGPAIEHARGYNIVSDGIAPGSIQVPGTGQPIVLLADRQTTGGYPKIATVISADVPALGRLKPGAKLAFEAVDLAQARAARMAQEGMLETWRAAMQPVADEAYGATLDRLMAQNLVSGVVDAWSGSSQYDEAAQ